MFSVRGATCNSPDLWSEHRNEPTPSGLSEQQQRDLMPSYTGRHSPVEACQKTGISEAQIATHFTHMDATITNLASDDVDDLRTSPKPLLEASREELMEAFHSSPELTTEDAELLLKTTRAFYKNGTKSDNKFYQPEAREKHAIRNRNRATSRPTIEAVRSWDEAKNNDVLGVGARLLSDRLTAGNCEEMSAVAVKLSQQYLSHKCKAAFTIGCDPGDHTFILLSKDGSEPPILKSDENEEEGLRAGRWGSIATMHDPENNFLVVDPWLNVASPASFYQTKIRRQVTKWEEQGKFISSGLRHFSPRQWSERLDQGYLYIDSRVSLARDSSGP
jgi:hypothetical protein